MRALVVLAGIGFLLAFGVTVSLGDIIGSSLANDPTTSGPCTGQGNPCLAFQTSPAVTASSAGTLTAFRLKKKDGELTVSPAVVRKNSDGTFKVVKIGDPISLPAAAGIYDETLTTPLDVITGDYPALAYAAGGPHAYHVTYHADGSSAIGYIYNASQGGSYTPQSDKYELLVQWTVTPKPGHDVGIEVRGPPAVTATLIEPKKVGADVQVLAHDVKLTYTAIVTEYGPSASHAALIANLTLRTGKNSVELIGKIAVTTPNCKRRPGTASCEFVDPLEPNVPELVRIAMTVSAEQFPSVAKVIDEALPVAKALEFSCLVVPVEPENPDQHPDLARMTTRVTVRQAHRG